MKQKIAVFQPDGNINNNPNLSGFCNLLAEKGFVVDVWSLVDKGNPSQLPPQCNINLYLVQSFSDVEVIVSNYSFAIGIDYGIIYAANLAKILNIDYGFISYELFFDDEIVNKFDLENKAKAKEACKGVIFAIIQDTVRARFLMDEYGISSEKILYMPVAGDGMIRYEKSYFLHDHLSLPHTTKILLQIGSVASWTMTDWAISQADSLPEEWVLAIHNRFGTQTVSSKHNRVLYSNLPPLRIDQMQELIQSAACCLGLYTPIKGSVYTGKNIEYMGLASGKIATSLQYGVPVALNQIGELTKLITAYQAGVVVDTKSDSPFKCLEQLADTSKLTVNCHQLFSEHLDLRKFSDKILETIHLSMKKNNSLSIDYNWYKDSRQKTVYSFDHLPLKQQLPCLVRLFSRLLKRLIKHLLLH